MKTAELFIPNNTKFDLFFYYSLKHLFHLLTEGKVQHSKDRRMTGASILCLLLDDWYSVLYVPNGHP